MAVGDVAMCKRAAVATSTARSRVRLLVVTVVLVAASASVLMGCSGPEATGWVDITASPGAQDYEGSAEAPLDDRLSGRLAERDLELIDSRVERLPEGVAWTDHLAWRDEHVGDLERIEDRIPEPDAPVLVAEYQGDGRTLFVVATGDGADEARGRLVVLTALAM